ncbi:MAG: nickel-dependent hydrogenase large subunit [Rhodocyclaceae bacterium]|nr:nickel-dependent hydrogenase large subunit [Rhodocyclaceae bacterium]
MARRTLGIDLNRVEGDLEFEVDLEDNRIVNARCIGTLFRGFEQLLVDRAPRDSLVITPRVCGICGTAHLYTAVLALERIGQLAVPPQATLIRNLCLMAENVQSDLRQTFLFFVPDFLNPRYAGHPLAAEVARAFQPMKGSAVVGALGVTRKILQVVAIFGGQWPHSSYMLPGGVTRGANERDIVDCRELVESTIAWVEDAVLGDRLEAFLDLDSLPALERWLAEPARAGLALPLFCAFSRSIGLDRIGGGARTFLSGGSYHDPEAWGPPYGDQKTLLAAGIFDADDGSLAPFDPDRVSEHVRHSWFRPYEGGRHPYQGETVPDYQPGTDRYTWAKAPRYGEQVVETGPLAELLAAGDALCRDIVASLGPNTWLRQFARLRRAARVLLLMREHVEALGRRIGEPHYLHPAADTLSDGDGFGLVQAARGTLGHWVQIRDGRIARYQIVTPTAWNASPRDSAGRHGHWEQSVIGLELADTEDPVELGHIVRSHDPCLVCTVHFAGSGKRIRYGV